MPLVNIGPGFYNIRAPFKVAAGLIDVGTHMSICRLTNGNYLVIDTVNLDAQLKSEIDALTNGGSKIQAVVATHPFHTLAFRGFYSHYPNAKYYGTPRHLRVIPEIPWVGDLQCPKTRALWEPDVFMRIPAGSEFVDPKPELSNHFSNVFVYHVESKTVHNDDTILFSDNPGWLLKMLGFKDGTMMFHPSLKGPGLYPTKDAPLQFKAWLEQLLQDWDFENLCSAHNGCRVGGARDMVAELLHKATPKLQKISDSNAKGKPQPISVGAWGKDQSNVECG